MLRTTLGHARAVKWSGHALEWASKSLKADKEVVLAAVKSYAPALKRASKSLKKDPLFESMSGSCPPAGRFPDIELPMYSGRWPGGVSGWEMHQDSRCIRPFHYVNFTFTFSAPRLRCRRHRRRPPQRATRM